MKNNIKILSLSAAMLLVMIVLVIVIRRRGRKVSSDGSPMSGGFSLSNQISSILGKKVYVKDSFKNSVLAIWYDDFDKYYYFDKTLEYVIIPNNPDRIKDEDGKVFVEVSAVGHSLGGRTIRTVLSKKAYIAQNLLNI